METRALKVGDYLTRARARVQASSDRGITSLRALGSAPRSTLMKIIFVALVCMADHRGCLGAKIVRFFPTVEAHPPQPLNRLEAQVASSLPRLQYISTSERPASSSQLSQ